MASAGAPASDLVVHAPAASTEAEVLTAGATIREGPEPAATVLLLLLLLLLLLPRRARASYTAVMSCLHCCTLHESVAVFFVEMDGREHEHNNILLYGFIRPGIRV